MTDATAPTPAPPPAPSLPDAAFSRAHRTRLLLLCTVPAAIALLVGLTHPNDLNPDTAGWWRTLHIILLPVFPAMGLAPWLIARVVDCRLGWLAAAGGYGFATCYTALDVLAGIGGGSMVLGGQSDATGPLFRIANELAIVGVGALLVGTLVASVAAIIRARLAAIPGAVLALIGVVLIANGHIYFPQGTLALLLLIAGYTVLAVTVTRPRRVAA